jgi:hypothetical protein
MAEKQEIYLAAPTPLFSGKKRAFQSPSVNLLKDSAKNTVNHR